MSNALSLENLRKLQTPAAIPCYQRSQIKGGIVHFGIGNFHRSHQAVYLDELFNLGLDHDWGIIGAGVTTHDGAMREKLKVQDYLTTVVEQDVTKSEARVTGAMIDFLDPADRDAIIQQLADPAIRIVSMTITEGGYFINPASGQFDAAHPDIVADADNPTDPKTVFGIVLAGLKLRRDRGISAFTVMSCDNIPGNGHVTANAVSGLAQLSDSDLAAWITHNVAFPNSMVDRITPATGSREIAHCEETFHIADRWPVYCEEFRQWVMEDNFTAGRPALEKVGVTFVDDVSPYEFMKIRILNGGHAAIAYPASLLDIHFVHDAMGDAQISAFLDKLERDEVIPTVPPVPDTDLNDYLSMIQHRFSNPNIADTIPRLAYDGSNRQPKFIIPPIVDRLRTGESIDGLALVSALWCRHCYGTTESGANIAPSDPVWDRLKKMSAEARSNPGAWISMSEIYGDLGQSEIFVGSFAKSLKAIWESGTRDTLARYAGGSL